MNLALNSASIHESLGLGEGKLARRLTAGASGEAIRAAGEVNISSKLVVCADGSPSSGTLDVVGASLARGSLPYMLSPTGPAWPTSKLELMLMLAMRGMTWAWVIKGLLPELGVLGKLFPRL
jgi:hypothetical protein